MIIAPIIFCTIVLGVGSVAKAATVGKVGGLAMIYFLCMATLALIIGLVVGNLIHPGTGLQLKPYEDAAGGEENATVVFLLGLIPGDIRSRPSSSRSSSGSPCSRWARRANRSSPASATSRPSSSSS